MGCLSSLLCSCKNKPSCTFHILPSLRTPIYTRTNILNILTNTIPSNTIYSLSADSHFGNLGWMEVNNSQCNTVALAADNLPLGELFSYELKYHHYRVFSNGRVFLSVWHDNAVVYTMTTAFKISSHKRKNPAYHGITYGTPPPIMTVSEATNLSTQLDLASLQALAKKSGVSSSGSKLEIAYRIAGIPSLPTNVTLPSPIMPPPPYTPKKRIRKSKAA